MMRVYFVRHGDRADNSTSIFAGRDIPLSEKGKENALLLAQRFVSIPVDVIYSSPYERTRQTTEILNAVIKAEVREERLIEELGVDEPRPAVFKRANKFKQLLEKETGRGTVLVSAHGGIIKMIVFAMVFGEVHLDKAFKEFDKSFHMDFTGITLCRYEDDMEEEGKKFWHLVTWNDLGHLPPPA